MINRKIDDIEIIELDTFEFNFPTFKIIFENNTWVVEHNDPEIDDILVIEENNLIENRKMELFDNYVLTLEVFNSLKEIVENG